MGMIRKPTIPQYWNKKYASQDTQWFRSMFSRNRFQCLLKFLHVVDCSKLPPRTSPVYNPAARFQPLIDFVNRMFIRYYRPRKEVSVDESLVKTKGKTSMLQYIPSKKSKFGIKFWILAESVTGYILRIIVYRGKRFDPTPAGQLQGSNVVMSLLRETNLSAKGTTCFVIVSFLLLIWQNS